MAVAWRKLLWLGTIVSYCQRMPLRVACLSSLKPLAWRDVWRHVAAAYNNEQLKRVSRCDIAMTLWLMSSP